MQAEDASNYQEAETGDNQFSTTEELQVRSVSFYTIFVPLGF